MVSEWLDAYEFVYDLLADAQSQATNEGKLAGSNSVKRNDLPVGAGDENIGMFGSCCSPVGAHLDVVYILQKFTASRSPYAAPTCFLLENHRWCVASSG